MNQPLLTVAVTARALFDLRKADAIYKEQGAKKYVDYMLSIEGNPLDRGPAFYIVEALSNIVHPTSKASLVKIVLVSQTPPNASVVVQNSAEHHNIFISQYAFTGGREQFPFIKAFGSDLFLSYNVQDVATALKNGIASALLLEKWTPPTTCAKEVRIAFDGDAVLFSGDSEKYYQQEGLEKFIEHEQSSANVPMNAGPFKNFLLKLHQLQRCFPYEKCPITTALITARGGRVLKRPLLTLRHWDIDINVAIGLDGASKRSAIEAFKPHIFFDDRLSNCEDASFHSPAAQIPDIFDNLPQISSSD